jgi:hypothetical protein
MDALRPAQRGEPLAACFERHGMTLLGPPLAAD